MGTQTDIARAIRDGGGDYCMSLKKNWPVVHAEVEQLFTDPPDDVTFETKETVDLTAGRIETRRHTVCHKVDWMTSDRHYPGEPVFPDLAMMAGSKPRSSETARSRTDAHYISVFDRPLCPDIRTSRAGALGGGEPPALGAGRDLPRRPRTLPDRRRAAKHGGHPPHSPESALTRQTNHQSEKPAETRRLERRLPGNRHPPDCLIALLFRRPSRLWSAERPPWPRLV